MEKHNIKDCINKRVLIGGSPLGISETHVAEFSPTGKYVRLGVHPSDQPFGWYKSDSIEIIELLPDLK